MRAVILGGACAEIYVAERLARGARPTAVEPRTHDEDVVNAFVLLLDVLVSFERAVKVFGVEPAADRHHGALNVTELRQDVALLPKLVVVRMPHHLVPKRDVCAELLAVNVVGVGERSHLEKILVAVLRAVLEGFEVRGLGRHGHGSRLPEARVEIEGVRQEERPVVMKVVAYEPVADRRLRRSGFDRRMRVDDPGGRIKTGIRDAVHTNSIVVVRDVLRQPLDRVVSVRALVYVARRAVSDVGSDVDVIAFAHPAPAHILIDEDVAFTRVQV